MKPGFGFWGFAVLGTLLSTSFFFSKSAGGFYQADLLLALAVLSATLGYVEGGRLSREFGGRRVMSWAILLALPVGLGLDVWLYQDAVLLEFSGKAWLAILYLAVVSQSLGMFLWYRVLATGPMEKVALMQLLQPFFTLLAALYFLDEHVDWMAWLLAALVVLCIFGANRCKQEPVTATCVFRQPS